MVSAQKNTKTLREVVTTFSKANVQYVYVVSSKNNLFDPFIVVYYNGVAEFKDSFLKRKSKATLDRYWAKQALDPVPIDKNNTYSIRCW